MTTSNPVKVEHPVVAAFYDAYMWPQELMGFRRQRERMAAEATGRVLELAAGTGLTFPFYTRAQEVVAIDSDPSMLKRARRRAAIARCPVRLLQADADRFRSPTASSTPSFLPSACARSRTPKSPCARLSAY